MSGHSKWANIKRRKGAVDAARGQITTKISKEITVAVRLGGADPAGNMKLKMVLQKARENNVSKDTISRAIQKGQGTLEGHAYEELTYEGYGPGGSAVLIDVVTDNRNRAAAEIRHIFSKHGGNLGESGCVAWMFDQKGLFVIDKNIGIGEEDLMMLALEAGAEDMKSTEDSFEIITAPEDFDSVQKMLEKNNIKTTDANITKLPQTTLAVSDEDAAKVFRLLDALEEHDDVQDVYTNVDLPDNEDESDE
jgi:YebC/PmpR family DNA-binding regulatory protein